MVCVKYKGFTSKVSLKVVHCPSSSLHFQQERRVITLVLLQFTACVSDDMVHSIRSCLRKNCTQAAGMLLISQCSIGYKSVLPVTPRETDYRFGAQDGLQFSECSKRGGRKCFGMPVCIFACEGSKWSRNLSKISNVSAKEITKTQKLPYFFDRGGGFSVSNCF